jgi:hypothetical protein
MEAGAFALITDPSTMSQLKCSSSEIGCIIRLKQIGQSDLTEAPMLK